MSEAENEEEAQATTQVGLEFFGALNDFFDKEPRTMIWLLHVVAGKVKEALENVSGLPNDAYKYMGEIDAIQGLFWDNDRNAVLIDAITDHDTKLGFMSAIAALAKLYTTIVSGDSINASVIRDRLEDITTALYEILKAVMDKAEAKACDDSDP
jgi:hypothetical protein